MAQWWGMSMNPDRGVRTDQEPGLLHIAPVDEPLISGALAPRAPTKNPDLALRCLCDMDPRTASGPPCVIEAAMLQPLYDHPEMQVRWESYAHIRSLLSIVRHFHLH